MKDYLTFDIYTPDEGKSYEITDTFDIPAMRLHMKGQRMKDIVAEACRFQPLQWGTDSEGSHDKYDTEALLEKQWRQALVAEGYSLVVKSPGLQLEDGMAYENKAWNVEIILPTGDACTPVGSDGETLLEALAVVIISVFGKDEK